MAIDSRLYEVPCRTTLYSRRENVLNQRFPYIASALKNLPNDTVVDGELVALGPDGRPDFHRLQNFRSAESRIVYYAFDILVHEGEISWSFPFERRAILSSVVEPGEHVALSEVSDRPAAEMLRFVKSHGLEGAVAKRSDSVYQPGQRTGLWSKYRMDLSQEFVVGGYIPSHLGLIRWWWASIAAKTLSMQLGCAPGWCLRHGVRSSSGSSI